jgi:hypothetical protein
VAPPAYYMLWLLKNGAPSIARWVQVLQAWNLVPSLKPK